MVSVKTLILGPSFAFSTHLDVHSVIAQSGHIIRIKDAVKGYIKSKRERGRTNEEIVHKLERVERVYVYVKEVHEAFYAARIEMGLPPSRVLYEGCENVQRPELHRSYSPVSSYSADFSVDDVASVAATQTSVASHAQLIPTTAGTHTGQGQSRPGMGKTSSWQRFLPAYRRYAKPSTSNPLSAQEQSLYGSSAASSAVTIRQEDTDIVMTTESELVAAN